MLFAAVSFGQLAHSGEFSNSNTVRSATDIDLKVYPNPAIHYIHLNNYAGEVKQIVFFNLVGRPIKRFPAVSGKNHYDLSELSRGLYLVQLMDQKGSVISTKRINKR